MQNNGQHMQHGLYFQHSASFRLAAINDCPLLDLYYAPVLVRRLIVLQTAFSNCMAQNAVNAQYGLEVGKEVLS